MYAAFCMKIIYRPSLHLNPMKACLGQLYTDCGLQVACNTLQALL
jgi:hypothetical protein